MMKNMITYNCFSIFSLLLAKKKNPLRDQNFNVFSPFHLLCRSVIVEKERCQDCHFPPSPLSLCESAKVRLITLPC